MIKPKATVGLIERIAALCAALVIVGLGIFLIIRNEPISAPELIFVLRLILSLSAAILGATIPGFLEVKWEGGGFFVRAGGALALFVLTFMYTPDLLRATERSGSRIPPNIFRIVEMGDIGETSLDYLKSLLGTPKIEREHAAEFVVNGYHIIATTKRERGRGELPGVIAGLEVRVVDPAVARRFPVILDGYWNSGRCDDRGRCRSQVEQLSLGDMLPLERYTDDCNIGFVDGVPYRREHSYLCYYGGMTVTRSITFSFHLSVSDQRATDAANLWNHISSPSDSFLPPEYANRLQEQFGLIGKTRDEMEKHLEWIITDIYFRSRVIGFSIEAPGNSE